MTNHLHLIVNCEDKYEVKDVIRHFKRHTVKQIIFQIQNKPKSRRAWMLKIFQTNSEEYSQNTGIKFWQSGNHAIELFTEKFVVNLSIAAKLLCNGEPGDVCFFLSGGFSVGCVA